MNGMPTRSGSRRMRFFEALRELRGPVSALAVLMLVLNVTFAGGVPVYAGDGGTTFSLITCFNANYGSADYQTDDDIDRHDCLYCCFATAPGLAPSGPKEATTEIEFTVVAVARPDNQRLETVVIDPAAPIRAPPALS